MKYKKCPNCDSLVWLKSRITLLGIEEFIDSYTNTCYKCKEPVSSQFIYNLKLQKPTQNHTLHIFKNI